MKLGLKLHQSTLGYILIGLSYTFIGIIAAHPLDGADYAFNAQIFYYLHGSPFMFLPMGIYYGVLNVAGYFPTALISLFSKSNVLSIQFGVKIPFILFAFLSSYILYRLASHLKYGEKWTPVVLLTSPIYFFTSLIYGSAIVVSMFFLICGLYFALNRKTVASAIMYGISVGSYLYPVFAIPVFVRYFAIKKDSREAIKFLLISALIGAVGQVVLLSEFIRTGQSSVLSSGPYPYFGINSSIPYYNLFDFLNVIGRGDIIPGMTYDIIYYGSAIIFSLSYFIVNRRSVNDETLVVFLLVQGVLFAAFAPINLPSFMSAVIPLAIIATLYLKRWIFIGMTWVSSFFSFLVMQTITHVGVLVYFSDINIKILIIKIYPWSSYPSWINSIAGSLYVASLLAFIPVALLRKKGNLPNLRKSIAAQSAAIGAIVLVGALLLAPVASSIPQDMYLSPSIDSFAGYGSNEYIVGTSLVVAYYFPNLGTMDKAGIDHFLGKIEFPSGNYNVYILSSSNTANNGDFIQHILLPYPLNYATLQLEGNVSGDVSLTLENSTSSLSPREMQTQSNDSALFSFNVNSYLSGSYALYVNSSVPLYLHNITSLALTIIGNPAFGLISINNTVISNYTVEPGQLGGTVLVKCSGPFYRIPAELPVIDVQMVEPLGKPIESQLTIGGFAFASLIVLPPSLLVFLTSKRREAGPKQPPLQL